MVRRCKFLFALKKFEKKTNERTNEQAMGTYAHICDWEQLGVFKQKGDNK